MSALRFSFYSFSHLTLWAACLCMMSLFPRAVAAEPMHALAMHGEPKYSADFKRLDYVNPKAPKGGHVTRFKIGTFDTLNPYSLKGNAATGLNLFYDRLMARVWDEPFTMYPLIAEKVEVAEDRSAITFFLNPEAKFQDGTPILSTDVKFSFETLKQHGRPNMRRVYDLVSKVELKDLQTIHFQLGEGYDQETIMILAMMPVLSETWWQGRNFNETVLDVPMSSGPYLIKEVKPGQKIVYERDPNYWAKDLPVNVGHFNFDQITFDYYRDDTVAFEAFKAGDVDIRREWNVARWATGYNVAEKNAASFVKEEIGHQRPERVQSFIFNTRRKPFDDEQVREALNYALDFSWINNNLFHGLYRRVESYFPNANLAASGAAEGEEAEILLPWVGALSEDILETSWQAPITDTRETLRESLSYAQKLLDEAGWIIVDGKRVKRSNPDKVFSFEILIGSPEQEKVALAYTRNLKRLGIDARVRVLDSAGFTGRLQKYDYDMVLHYWQNSLSPGTEQFLYWSCEAAEQESRWNYAGICDPVIDELATQIAQVKTRESLVAYARALDRVLMAGHYIVPLYYAGQDYVAYNKMVKRPDATPLYGMVMETWWMDPATQN